MSEAATIHSEAEPLTIVSLAEAFRSLGVREGQVVLVHAAMSRLGWVCGGPQAVVEALIRTVGSDGTLAMPAHTSGNSEPIHQAVRRAIMTRSDARRPSGGATRLRILRQKVLGVGIDATKYEL